MPHNFPEDHELAGRAWARLLVLRASDYPSALPSLRTLAETISIDRQPALESHKNIRSVRADAWLAVCKLAQQIEKDPKAGGIEALWVDATDTTKSWERCAE